MHATGPWRMVDALELATAALVSRWNTRRLHGALDWRIPEEYETEAAEQHRDHSAA